MGRDNKRHPNGTVLIEPRSSAKQLLKKPTEEAPVLLLAAVIPVLLLTAVIPVLLAQAAPPVVLLATWDITVPLLLAEPLNALALGASEAVCSVCLAAALLLATWDITVLLLLAELLNALALGASEAVCSVCLAAALAAISLVVLLATWDITVLLLLAELFATFHRFSLWLFGPAELFHAYAQVARDALGTEVPSSTLFISQPIAGFLIAVP